MTAGPTIRRSHRVHELVHPPDPFAESKAYIVGRVRRVETLLSEHGAPNVRSATTVGAEAVSAIRRVLNIESA